MAATDPQAPEPTTHPDTEEILVLVGVMLPLVLLAWPKVLAGLAGVGAFPLIGLLAWVVAWGGRGRETAIVGAVASLGLLVAEPFARWLRGSPRLQWLPDGPAGAVAAGVLQAVVVLGPARLAGLQHDLTMSIAIAAGILIVATGALAASPAPSRRKH